MQVGESEPHEPSGKWQDRDREATPLVERLDELWRVNEDHEPAGGVCHQPLAYECSASALDDEPFWCDGVGAVECQVERARESRDRNPAGSRQGITCP